jgi:hypothetical protein
MKSPDAIDRIVFLVVVVAALFCARSLYLVGKDASAVGILGAAVTMLSAYWGQLQAQAARQTALLVPPESVQPAAGREARSA